MLVSDTDYVEATRRRMRSECVAEPHDVQQRCSEVRMEVCQTGLLVQCFFGIMLRMLWLQPDSALRILYLALALA